MACLYLAFDRILKVLDQDVIDLVSSGCQNCKINGSTEHVKTLVVLGVDLVGMLEASGVWMY